MPSITLPPEKSPPLGPLRIAQAAMRHSKPELTANVYTDPKLLDVAGALNALPAFETPASESMVDCGRA